MQKIFKRDTQTVPFSTQGNYRGIQLLPSIFNTKFLGVFPLGSMPGGRGHLDVHEVTGGERLLFDFNFSPILGIS